MPTKTSTEPKNSAATASSSADEEALNVAPLGAADSTTARAVRALLARFGITLTDVAPDTAIPGSFWGEREAGLVGARLHARPDTPIHSILHEACHWICMDPARRRQLHTNAGGSSIEECAVCYLSILLADHLRDFSRQRMMRDMDRWGYSFRLGSSSAWFEHDADDAQRWLREHALIDETNTPTWRIRG